jgi:hypothetical protein
MIILLLAMSIDSFKNKYLQIALLLLFLFFSIKNLIYDKKFYSSYYKTQFSHAISYMVQKHGNETIVAKLGGFYLNYYLNQNNYQKPVIENDINAYVSSIKTDTLHVKSFWYFDGHLPVFSPTNETKSFLEKNYFLDDSVEYFDAFVKHYVIKSDYKPKSTYSPNVNLLKFKKPYKDRNGDSSNSAIEIFKESDKKIEISGWIYFDNQSTDNVKIQLLLINENEEIVLNTDSISRTDVTSYFKSKYDLSRSGFKTKLLKENFKAGFYTVAIYIKDSDNKKEALIVTDKKVLIN